MKVISYEPLKRGSRNIELGKMTRFGRCKNLLVPLFLSHLAKRGAICYGHVPVYHTGIQYSHYITYGTATRSTTSISLHRVQYELSSIFLWRYQREHVIEMHRVLSTYDDGYLVGLLLLQYIRMVTFIRIFIYTRMEDSSHDVF